MHCKGREVLHILRKISAHPDTLIVNNYVFAGPPELVGQRRSSVSRLLVGGQEMAAIASISDLDSEEAAGEEEEEGGEDGGEKNSNGTADASASAEACHVVVRINTSKRGGGTGSQHDVLVTVNYSFNVSAHVAAWAGTRAGAGAGADPVHMKHKTVHHGVDGVWTCLMRMLRRYGVEVCSASLSGGTTIFHRIHGKVRL